MALQNELVKTPTARDEGRIKAARDVLTKTLEMLNRELEGKEYLGGESFSLADVAFAPMVLQLEKLGIFCQILAR